MTARHHARRMPATEVLDRPRVQRAALVLLAAFLMLGRLGNGHLANFDDCYYAEKAKEMVRDGYWLTPHFAGSPCLDNGPFFLWLMALSFRVFGVTDWAAILFSAVSGVLCVALVVSLARRLGLDDFEAWAAGVVLLGTQYFLKYSRHAMFDVFLTLLFLISIDAYVRSLAGARRWLLVLGLATGIGVLTKSVLGLFPLVTVMLHSIWAGRWRSVINVHGAGAIAIAALVIAPWYAYQYAIHHDQFLEEHVRWLLWRRAFVTGRESRSWTGYFGYLRQIGTVYWPWLPLAAWGAAIDIRRALRGDSTARLLIVWFVVVVGTMSLAIEQKLWYVMSAFPCLALFSARAAGGWIQSPVGRRKAITWGFGILLAVTALLTLTPLGTPAPRRPDLQQMALIAREVVPPGQAVLNLDTPYWPVVNQFIFYSDHDLTQPLRNVAAVRAGLDRGGFALLSRLRYADLAGSRAASYPVIAAAGDWMLVKAAPSVPAVLPARDPFH